MSLGNCPYAAEIRTVLDRTIGHPGYEELLTRQSAIIKDALLVCASPEYVSLDDLIRVRPDLLQLKKASARGGRRFRLLMAMHGYARHRNPDDTTRGGRWYRNGRQEYVYRRTAESTTVAAELMQQGGGGHV